MGPSGAGKDTLLAYARARVDPARVVFAHRYITRSAEAGGENHVALSENEFAARRDAGHFALWWESHDLFYAVGGEIDLWLACGQAVVVNGARAAWMHARTRYPGIAGIVIDAPHELRARRLALRAREDEGAIRARLAHEVDLPSDASVALIDNSGPVETAGAALAAMIARAAA